MQVVLDVLKSPIFVMQTLALHQNGDIRISLATMYDVVRRRATELKFSVYILTHSPIHPFTHSLTKSCMEASTLPKNSLCRPGPLSLVPSPCWYWLCVCEGEGGDGPDQF